MKGSSFGWKDKGWYGLFRSWVNAEETGTLRDSSPTSAIPGRFWVEYQVSAPLPLPFVGKIGFRE